MTSAGGDRRIALAHDWLVGLRGGERVLDRLARLFGPTDLYTLVDDGRFVTDAIAACRVVTSPLQRFPGARGRWRRHYLPLMPWAVNRLRVAPCDLLISTSSAVMKAIRPPRRPASPGGARAAPSGHAPHLCYCHSPARYIWEQTADYAAGAGGRLRAAALRAAGGPLRRWDRATTARVTRFLANSRHTAARIERCWGRTADVVHPPVRTGYFTPDERARREPWLLVVAALEPYKRTDLVIEAANRLRCPLKVVGTGSQARELAARAGPTVEMLGRADDATLLDLYRRARVLLFPQLEDFGIVAVEAQAAGCPVIAFAPDETSGGARETVTGETGLFFSTQSAAAIAGAIESFTPDRFDPAACRRNAERFSEEVFDRAIVRHVEEMLEGGA